MLNPRLFNINFFFFFSKIFSGWISELKKEIISSLIFLPTSIMQNHTDSTQGQQKDSDNRYFAISLELLTAGDF